MQGIDDATMAPADNHEARESVLHLPVGPDQVGAYRVLVMAPDHGASTRFDFSLRNTTTGESTAYHTVFLGPESAASERHNASGGVH